MLERALIMPLQNKDPWRVIMGLKGFVFRRHADIYPQSELTGR